MREQATVMLGTGGVGSTVFIILLILKITGNIAMSWFWVLTSFVWSPIILFVGILAAIVGIGTIAILFGLIVYSTTNKKR